MSTNLARDINKHEIIFLVLTYVMNDSCLTSSTVCGSNPGGSILLLKPIGAADPLHLKNEVSYSQNKHQALFSSLFQGFGFAAFITKKSN